MRSIRSLFGITVLLVIVAGGAPAASAQSVPGPVSPGDGTQPGLPSGGVVTTVAPQGRIDPAQSTGGAVAPGSGAGVGVPQATPDDDDNTVAGWLLGLGAVAVLAAVAALILNRARAGRGPDAAMAPRR